MEKRGFQGDSHVKRILIYGAFEAHFSVPAEFKDPVLFIGDPGRFLKGNPGIYLDQFRQSRGLLLCYNCRGGEQQKCKN